jgi:ankyrin repeat protein
MLFDHGADAHIRDFYDRTPLDALYAEVERSHGELEEDYVNCMRQALEEGGKIDLKLIPLVEKYDFEGLVNYFQDESVSDERKLLDVDERDPIHGGTALWIAIDLLANGNVESTLQVSTQLKIITLLLEKGSNPDVLPDQKSSSDMSTPVLDSVSPIYLVCKALHQELVQGDDDTNDDMTALKIEVLKQVASLLKSYGATSTPCISILHDAARRGHDRIIQFLVEEMGIDPNTKGRQGLTSLHFAARSGRVNVVKLLLSFASIDPMIVDDRGKTALDAAIVNEKDAIVDLLNAHMKL